VFRSLVVPGISATLEAVDDLGEEQLPPGAVIRGRDTVLDTLRLPPPSPDSASGSLFADTASAWSLSAISPQRRRGVHAAALAAGRAPGTSPARRDAPQYASVAMSDASSEWALSHAGTHAPYVGRSLQLGEVRASLPAVSERGATMFSVADSTWGLSDAGTTVDPAAIDALNSAVGRA